MTSPHPRHPAQPRRSRRARSVALVACAVTLTALGASGLLATGAQGDQARSASQQARVLERSTARAALAKAAARAPLARGGRCLRTTAVPGQGRSCRTADGLWLVPQRDGTPLVTHGPDVVASTARRGRAGGFGSAASVICSPASRTRHVALLYLVPKDFASGTGAVHGDRYAQVAEELRQAMYDASALVDRRAGELAGQRRRIRVVCDDDGRPSVERVVLPHTSAEYLAADSGFRMLGDDLAALGHLPEYDDFSQRRVGAVRRVLAYYDADFHPGYAGQGTMFRRSSLLRQGMRAGDPLLSRTSRNINNNPPSASLAVQYGTRDWDGVPDPPLYTSLLHELAHTMGAVQDEPATSSDAGHCVDGLDLMCYADSAGSAYTETACPDADGNLTPEDEQFDCNGDTYFHPAPPTGNPLAGATTWHLGLPANETLATTAASAPAGVASVRSSGVGTRRVLRWPAVTGAVGYEVAYRRAGAAWEYLSTTRPVAVPMLRPRTTYQLRVAAFGRGLVLGPRAGTSLRTGLDNSPPVLPARTRLHSTQRTSVRLRFVHSADNVRVTRYRVERRQGRRWVQHTLLPAPLPRVAKPGQQVVGPSITRLRPRTRYILRLRAIDGRGNVSAPSAAVVATTRR